MRDETGEEGNSAMNSENDNAVDSSDTTKRHSAFEAETSSNGDGASRREMADEPSAGDSDSNGSPGANTALIVAIVLGVLIVGAAAAALAKLWDDRMSAQKAVIASTDALSVTMSPDMHDALKGRVEAVREAAKDGRFVEAASRLENLTRGVGPRSTGKELGKDTPAQPPGPAPGFSGKPWQQGKPSGEKNRPAPDHKRGPNEQKLPEGARKFFQNHRKLAQMFVKANRMGHTIVEKGGDAKKLREILDTVVKAAANGDEQGVVELLKQFEKQFRQQAKGILQQRDEQIQMPQPPRKPRPPQRKKPPKEFKTVVERWNKALKKARREGKNVRPALKLVRKANKLARKGSFNRAIKLTRQGLQKLKKAEKLPPQPRLFQNPLVRMLLNLINVEDKQLTNVVRSLKDTLQQAKQQSLKALADKLQQGLDTLQKIGERRTEVGKELQRLRGGQPSEQDRRKRRDKMQKQLQQLREKVGRLLQKANEMPREKFEAQRRQLVKQTIDTVFGRQQQPKQPSAAETTERLSQKPAAVEKRTRKKLLRAAEPYLKVKHNPQKKELAKELDRLFSKARTLLTEHKCTQAEMVVDRGLALLGITPVPKEKQGQTAGEQPLLQTPRETPLGEPSTEKGAPEQTMPKPELAPAEWDGLKLQLPIQSGEAGKKKRSDETSQPTAKPDTGPLKLDIPDADGQPERKNSQRSQTADDETIQ